MNPLSINIRRSVGEIGGNCIEIKTVNTRILLDIGMPLYANSENATLPEMLDTSLKCDGVLISHPHQDHWGLLHKLPNEWPVFCGKHSEGLIKLTCAIFDMKPIHKFKNWQSGLSFNIGDIKITPFLTDHSAFDAYMLLLEANGKTILYTGDFRTHGRKAKLVEDLIRKLPSNIDALIMEGTNIGTNKPTPDEASLEIEFFELFKKTNGRVFINWSAQNIDRTVTIYRACLKAQKPMIIDAYTAEIMRLLEPDYPRLPTIGWGNLHAVITKKLSRMYTRNGKPDYISSLAKSGNAMSVKTLAKSFNNAVVMTRSGALLNDFIEGGLLPSGHDAFVWSNWAGYLKDDAQKQLIDWFSNSNIKPIHIHTSGHASRDALKSFVKSIAPKILIPIHGENWKAQNESEFPNIIQVKNNEPVLI